MGGSVEHRQSVGSRIPVHKGNLDDDYEAGRCWLTDPLSLRNLWSELRSIRYNLNTNNGRIFLGGEDEERLDRLINHIANSLCFSVFEQNGGKEQ